MYDNYFCPPFHPFFCHIFHLHKTNPFFYENEIEKNYIDYIEMILDWESARYTKPDKPLNAYDTLDKYYPNMEHEILPILKEFEIDKPNLPMEKDVLEYANSLKNISMEDIEKAIFALSIALIKSDVKITSNFIFEFNLPKFFGLFFT